MATYIIYTYFACSTNARVPERSGADALVPVKSSVHLLFSVVVLYTNVDVENSTV